MHLMRAAIFAAILGLIHQAQLQRSRPPALPPEQVAAHFPGQTVAHAVQTSPQADHIIGFSGPSNVIIAFDEDGRIFGMAIASTGDTREHVDEVMTDPHFLASLNGKTWQEAANTSIDAVSGATLTSLAIAESIALRLGGEQPSLRFPEQLTLDDAKRVFRKADSLADDGTARQGKTVLGRVLRPSPIADNIVGYQGPSDTYIGLDPDGKIVRAALGKSYDNQPYTDYLREDYWLRYAFKEQTLEELAQLDLESVEGVSGATMTSRAIGEGLARFARVATRPVAESAKPRLAISAAAIGTAAMIVFGTVMGFSRLRGRRRLRIFFQVVLIGYLGLINGDLLSQAMIVGWAKAGVPWRSALALVLLSVAAFLSPLLTKQNLYCSQLCPHGALQQLLRNRLPWRLKLSKRVSKGLELIPFLLLLWVVIVGITGMGVSLVGIEPFDAWVFRIAGPATITVAIVGLLASLFVPMAYCRFGCPTGALLDFLRLNARSDRFGRADAAALGCLCLAIVLLMVNG
jgi:Na+-translocating ferredoxin:NAD+ oxidoreductase RnfG subunit